MGELAFNKAHGSLHDQTWRATENAHMQIIRLLKLLHENITLQGKYKSKQMP